MLNYWGKVHKLKTNADIIRRIDGLEELYKSKNGGKVRSNEHLKRLDRIEKNTNNATHTNVTQRLEDILR